MLFVDTSVLFCPFIFIIHVPKVILKLYDSFSFKRFVIFTLKFFFILDAKLWILSR